MADLRRVRLKGVLKAAARCSSALEKQRQQIKEATLARRSYRTNDRLLQNSRSQSTDCKSVPQVSRRLLETLPLRSLRCYPNQLDLQQTLHKLLRSDDHNNCKHGRTGPPSTCQVGRLVHRPGGPPRQMLKQVKRLTPLMNRGKIVVKGREWS